MLIKDVEWCVLILSSPALLCSHFSSFFFFFSFSYFFFFREGSISWYNVLKDDWSSEVKVLKNKERQLLEHSLSHDWASFFGVLYFFIFFLHLLQGLPILRKLFLSFRQLFFYVIHIQQISELKIISLSRRSIFENIYEWRADSD